MEKRYNPSNIEQTLYTYWEKNGYFKPNNVKNKESFCIITPPPNITGGLHMGHAFQHAIIDTIIRYQRMQGKNTQWYTGIDHAGIATQMIVERKIAIEERKTRYDYGRVAFVDKIWEWKEKSSNIIAEQMRRLGSSINWEHEHFTMDENISDAVKEAFVILYKQGLIYRSKRLINWDPKLCTAISDLEIENRESKGLIWYIRYPLADHLKTNDGKNYLIIATTRPETLLGDTGIAVNPRDQRYNNLIGKYAILPLINRYIPIIGDEYVNMQKGTGCLKVTPAHDFNDYEIGRRHTLPMINILTFNGYIRENAQIFDCNGNESNIYSNKILKQFQKLERFTAREKIIAAINAVGLLENVKTHYSKLPYSDRSNVIIEPMLTDQWFLRISLLAKPAIEAVKNGNIKFLSKQYENMYFSWMNNVHDWCISRQLWWGHRIPAWYDDKGNIYVGRSKKEIYQENNFDTDVTLYQDDDVLDTWFSSALWSFSIFGWPKKTNNLHQFYPTNIIVSGFDIIFFWIARMIMLAMHFIKDENGNPQIPFKIIYITGLIRDDIGQKMSKSKGNVIDPIDIIDGISLQNLLIKRTDSMLQPQLADKICRHTRKQFPNGIKAYGTDALRLTLVALATNSRSINWDMQQLENHRNFCNKLWNACRFILMNVKDRNCGFNDSEKILSLADRWILSELNIFIKSYREALDNFRFNIAANNLYKFIWNQFCDWYLEFTKLILNNSSNEIELRGTRNTLVTVLEKLLRLAHPIIPFITETIWQRIKSVIGVNSSTIMLQQFPQYNSSYIDEMATTDIEWIKMVIIAIRNVRTEINVAFDKPLKLLFRNCSKTATCIVDRNHNFLQTAARLEKITILPTESKYPVSIIKIIDGADLLIPIEGLINKTNELNRLSKEIINIENEIKRIENKLINKNFINYAPKLIVAKEYEKLSHYKEVKTKLVRQLNIVNLL